MEMIVTSFAFIFAAVMLRTESKVPSSDALARRARHREANDVIWVRQLTTKSQRQDEKPPHSCGARD